MNRISLAAVVALCSLACPAAAAAAPPAEPIELAAIGRTPALGEAQAEIAAFHARSKRVFATNPEANRLDIYDFADPTAPTLIESVDLAPFGGGPNSVAVSKRGVVAVAVEADDKTDPGTVEFLDTAGERLCGVAVGALPDMLTFTDSERALLVANEGEPSDDGLADPEGSVSVLDLGRGPCRARVRTAGFDRTPLLNGPRIVTAGNTPSKDFEPEYIATAGGLAWVTIQEANAIGLLDIDRARFLYVRGLGYKDHGRAENALDPNDRDGPLLGSFPNVFGMYQPDAIAAYSSRRGIHLVTANEGDARENDVTEEESRVSDLMLDPAAFPGGAGALARLNVTTTQGDTDGDGDYDELYAFGARSMSVLDRFGRVRFDTGSELERFVRDQDPTTFNANHSLVPQVDNRSDNKGPEPEAVAVGEVRGTTYAFLGAERQGGIFAYDLDARPGQALLAGYVNTRPDDRGPEGALFIEKRDSPTRKPLLLVTNEVTGTIAAFELRPR